MEDFRVCDRFYSTRQVPQTPLTDGYGAVNPR
jgi:hypothetical protein